MYCFSVVLADENAVRTMQPHNYQLTKDSNQALAGQRTIWESFIAAINRVVRLERA